jgi:hypothetical protein
MKKITEMKRLNSIEELQDAIMLNKEIYLSLYHTKTEGKLFQQILQPTLHIDNLKQRIVELKSDDIRGVFSSDEISTNSKQFFN